MKITVAIDSFKGSLSSLEAAEAIKKGIHTVYPEAHVAVCPMADGGEGTVDAIVSATGGTMQSVRVCGPLGDAVLCQYGITPEKTAVIEMSAAAGITLIDADKRNPLHTTTYGVGQMINDAISNGCRRFIIGLGGSATNDGGAGMLQALGFGLHDKDGKDICRGALGLKDLVSIDDENVPSALRECTFCVACDVKNPLCGDYGCSSVYGPQKGATPQMIKDMDAWLENYARLTNNFNPHSDRNIPGCGAAGGMGFAFLSYTSATLESGIDIVTQAVGLEREICDSDIVVTGEGRLDGQSVMGKTPAGVASIAKKHGKAVIAISGCIGDGARACNSCGIDAYFPVLQKPCSLDEAMDNSNARDNMEKTAEQIFRLIKAVREG